MKKTIALVFLSAASALPAQTGSQADVLHEMKPCLTYRAKLDGDLLVIEASIQPGWHTFAIDNERRASEKLAGKPSIGIDQPTQIKVSGGLQVAGPWYETAPKDFSKPEMRWYSWGFEQQATFAAKVHRTGSGNAEVEIRGQACTTTTCKNIDVSLSLPAAPGDRGATHVDLKSLVQVR